MRVAVFSLAVVPGRDEDARREQNPEVEVHTNHKRVWASERMYSSAGGNRP
jgi:hypothetical protein